MGNTNPAENIAKEFYERLKHFERFHKSQVDKYEYAKHRVATVEVLRKEFVNIVIKCGVPANKFMAMAPESAEQLLKLDPPK